MYRILHDNAEVRERRNFVRHPNYHKPELLATASNEVSSWDIVRHEALFDRVAVGDRHAQAVAAV